MGRFYSKFLSPVTFYRDVYFFNFLNIMSTRERLFDKQLL